MTRLNTCAALLVASVLSIQAQTAPSPQQLLDAAHALTDLSALGPYKLTASFVVTPLDKKGKPITKKKQTGSLVIFRDHDRARFEARLGADHEIQFQIGNTRYIDASGTLFSIFALVNIDQSWDPERPGNGELHPHYTLSEPVRKKINEADAWCLQKRRGEGSEELCFAGENSALVKAKHYKFSDYQKMGALQFPRHVEIERREMPPVEITDISATVEHPAPDAFQVPERMVPIESCEDWRVAKAVFMPEPNFTDAARKHKGGFAYVNVIIGMDGKVIGAQALTQDPYGLAQESTNKVKTWKFEPATCGGHPVNAEMKVEVDFNMY